jgi:hypothetical protein
MIGDYIIMLGDINDLDIYLIYHLWFGLSDVV